MSLSEWQAAGLDVHSVEADPRFVDPAGFDYQVKPGSPALELGFENFPMDQFGVIQPELKRLADQGHRTCNGYLHPEILQRRNEAARAASRAANY
jgi:hypothetical protein